MNLFLALAPLLLALALLLFLQSNALRAGLAALLAALLIVQLAPAFLLPVAGWLQALGRGAGTALTVLTILLPGLLFYHVLQSGGALQGLAGLLAQICPDRERQVLLLALGIAPFVESVSGFGVAIVISVPLLLAIGLPPLQSAMIGALGQLLVPWGALAVGTALGATLSGVPAGQLGAASALLAAPLPALAGLYVLWLAGGRAALLRHWLTALLAGALLTLGSYGFSLAPGIELAGVLASMLSSGAILFQPRLLRSSSIAAVNSGLPSSYARLDLRPLLPYLLLTLLLLVSRLLPPLQAWLTTHAVLRIESLGLQLALLYSPGLALLLSSSAAALLFRVRGAALAAALQRSWTQFVPGAIAITAFLATGQLMFAAGMIASLSQFAAQLGAQYLWLAPWLGALGGWLTGSNLGSNAMLATLQAGTAAQSGLAVTWVMGAQNAAGAYTTMIAPARLILASSAANLPGAESRLLRALAPAVLLALLLITIMLVLLAR